MRQPKAQITSFFLLMTLTAAALSAGLPRQTERQERAGQSTEVSRKLVLDRIEMIAQTGFCRRSFDQQNIDLNRLRLAARTTRFYSVLGPEGDLRFSEVVGKPAFPDETLRELALQTAADAFVLGYFDGLRYVRTRHVVLNRGYFAQRDSQSGTLRLTTLAEKQNLLLHELLHIALDKDDDDLNQRDLCPLRLISFCRNPSTTTSVSESD